MGTENGRGAHNDFGFDPMISSEIASQRLCFCERPLWGGMGDKPGCGCKERWSEKKWGSPQSFKSGWGKSRKGSTLSYFGGKGRSHGWWDVRCGGSDAWALHGHGRWSIRSAGVELAITSVVILNCGLVLDLGWPFRFDAVGLTQACAD